MRSLGARRLDRLPGGPPRPTPVPAAIVREGEPQPRLPGLGVALDGCPVAGEDRVRGSTIDAAARQQGQLLLRRPAFGLQSGQEPLQTARRT